VNYWSGRLKMYHSIFVELSLINDQVKITTCSRRGDEVGPDRLATTTVMRSQTVREMNRRRAAEIDGLGLGFTGCLGFTGYWN